MIKDDITKGHFNKLEKLDQYRMDKLQMKEKHHDEKYVPETNN